MYLFPGKARYRCEGEYPAVEFIILGCSAIACYSWQTRNLLDSFINFQLRLKVVNQDDVTETKNHLSQ